MPDVLATDHLMPGMSGADLACKARAIRPALSGYADVDGIAPDLPRLTKPFCNADLAASLSALLPNLGVKRVLAPQRSPYAVAPRTDDPS